MKLFIYGAGNNGRCIDEMLNHKYKNDIKTTGFLDAQKSGTVNGIDIFKPDEVDFSDARVVISLFDFKDSTDVFLKLKSLGCKDIWWFKTPKRIFGRDFFKEQCIRCNEWQENMLEHVEMHIMDACNLNCRGCTHFSPIFEKTKPSFDSRMNDVRALANKNIHIVQFNILGGEPFLNDEIERYVVECRRVLPDTEIVIVSNGLLIPTIDDRVLATIRDNNVKLSISEYSPTHKMIDRICQKLDSNSLIYNIRPFDTKEQFNKPLAIDNKDEHNKLCISDGCINIWNGLIARCPTLMFINEFNRKFDVKLPNEGIMDLNSCPEGRELIEILEKPVPLCRHCIENGIEWNVCGKDVKLDDFAV